MNAGNLTDRVYFLLDDFKNSNVYLADLYRNNT